MSIRGAASGGYRFPLAALLSLLSLGCGTTVLQSNRRLATGGSRLSASITEPDTVATVPRVGLEGGVALGGRAEANFLATGTNQSASLLVGARLYRGVFNYGARAGLTYLGVEPVTQRSTAGAVLEARITSLSFRGRPSYMGLVFRSTHLRSQITPNLWVHTLVPAAVIGLERRGPWVWWHLELVVRPVWLQTDLQGRFRPGWWEDRLPLYLVSFIELGFALHWDFGEPPALDRWREEREQRTDLGYAEARPHAGGDWLVFHGGVIRGPYTLDGLWKQIDRGAVPRGASFANLQDDLGWRDWNHLPLLRAVERPVHENIAIPVEPASQPASTR